MKLLHLADLHLGKTLGEFSLIDDQKYMLNSILKIADEKSVDAVLIAGDVYDKSVPSEAATTLLDYFLTELSDRNIKVYIISGNHDSAERLKYGSEIFEKKGIYITAKYEGELCCHVLKKGSEEVCIYMLPFVKAPQVRKYHPDEEINTYEDAVKCVLDSKKPDSNKVNILMAHQFITGSKINSLEKSDEDENQAPILAGSESIGTKTVGTVEQISYKCFDGYDYVALGHIHSPQRVGRDTVRYAGSMLKYSLSEANNEKSMPLIEINEKGELSYELIDLKPRRNLRHIKGNLKNLLDTNTVTDTDDYIYATLTNEEYISDAMGIFQQTYKNTVKIDYDNSRTKDVENLLVSQPKKSKTFEELISDFYMQIYGENISEEEMQYMKEAAGKAGIIDETN